LNVRYKLRLRHLQHALAENQIHALLVIALPNVRYLSGFSGSSAVLLVTEEDTVFFSDGRYSQQARDEVKGAHIVIGQSNLFDAAATYLKEHIRSRRGWRLGFEADYLTVSSRKRLAGRLPSGIRLTETHALVENARIIKDTDEIHLMQKAAKVGAGLLSDATEAIKNGKNEAEVAAEMEYSARAAGADAMSFSTIIAGGARSALPHARASMTAIPSGSFVVCDFGVILAGYCSDRTRTVFKGRPNADARNVYQAVLEAQRAGVEAIKPGVTAGEVDAACRKVLKSNNLDKYFTHSTGHGVGLEIHESPRLAAGQTQVLQPGMVVTVEPGVYIPGKWGVRIEDMVLVTAHGHEVLAPGSKELIAL
jgi:Xaa-Pro aminopeptidase